MNSGQHTDTYIHTYAHMTMYTSHTVTHKHTYHGLCLLLHGLNELFLSQCNTKEPDDTNDRVPQQCLSDETVDTRKETIGINLY